MKIKSESPDGGELVLKMGRMIGQIFDQADQEGLEFLEEEVKDLLKSFHQLLYASFMMKPEEAVDFWEDFGDTMTRLTAMLLTSSIAEVVLDEAEHKARSARNN